MNRCQRICSSAFMLVPLLAASWTKAQGTSSIGGNVSHYVTGTMDTLFAWYEQGFNPDAPTTGLPHAGIDQISPSISFRFQPYDQNNVMLMNAGHQDATMTFTNPVTANAIGIASATGDGPVFLVPTLHFSDGAPDYTPVVEVEPDWFYPTTSYMLYASGRIQINPSGDPAVYPGPGAFNEVGSTVPKIQFDRISLPSTVAAHPIASVSFAWSQTDSVLRQYSNTAIFGISTSTDGGSSYSAGDLTGSSFTNDVVVEASALPEPGSALALVSVSAMVLQRRRRPTA